MRTFLPPPLSRVFISPLPLIQIVRRNHPPPSARGRGMKFIWLLHDRIAFLVRSYFRILIDDSHARCNTTFKVICRHFTSFPVMLDIISIFYIISYLKRYTGSEVNESSVIIPYKVMNCLFTTIYGIISNHRDTLPASP